MTEEEIKIGKQEIIRNLIRQEWSIVDMYKGSEQLISEELIDDRIKETISEAVEDCYERIGQLEKILTSFEPESVAIDVGREDIETTDNPITDEEHVTDEEPAELENAEDGRELELTLEDEEVTEGLNIKDVSGEDVEDLTATVAAVKELNHDAEEDNNTSFKKKKELVKKSLTTN